MILDVLLFPALALWAVADTISLVVAHRAGHVGLLSE
jgi:hypothetical protein